MPAGPDTAVPARPATVTNSTPHARAWARSAVPHGRWNTPAMDTITEPAWTLRPAEPADLEAMTELRALVMRPDLERLGRYDEHRVRQRLRDIFAPEHTSVVLADGEFAGCVTMRPVEDGWWLENFYLSPRSMARGSAQPSCGPCWSAPTRTGRTSASMSCRAARHVGCTNVTGSRWSTRTRSMSIWCAAPACSRDTHRQRPDRRLICRGKRHPTGRSDGVSGRSTARDGSIRP